MAFREDWTRVTQSIHDLISAFRSSLGRVSGRTRNIMVSFPRVQRTTIRVTSTMNPRFLAEIENRRNKAYLSSLRNQIR